MKRFYLLIGALVIALDQITKYLVRANMQPGDKIPVIGDWMNIYYVQNTGTAFSMFAGNRFVTIFLTSMLIIFCIIFVVKESTDRPTLIPTLFTFVAAGGISNMIDRLTLGYVTDMISCGKFAVFNVADIGVTCGCIIIMIALVVMYKDEEPEDKSSEESEDEDDEAKTDTDAEEPEKTDTDEALNESEDEDKEVSETEEKEDAAEESETEDEEDASEEPEAEEYVAKHAKAEQDE